MEKQISSKIPFGVQDYLKEECFNRKRILDKFMDEFYLWGYDMIDTPSLEYYDTFALSSMKLDQKNLFKMTDSDGSLIVLRPDITLPISRIAATKLNGDMPIKLCYQGKIFKNVLITDVDNTREKIQAGVEYIGHGNDEADADVIALALTCLKKVGIQNCVVELGHVNFFKGLMEELGLEDELWERVRILVERKNMLELEQLLYSNKISEVNIKKLSKLTSLFGGDDVLDKAREICNNKKSIDALNNIKAIYSILENYGFSNYINVDLTLVQNLGYYTGMVFTCMTDYMGVSILSGGRYDGLSGNFGKSLQATGFAADIKKILISIEKQGVLKPLNKNKTYVLDLCNNSFSFSYINNLRSSNTPVEKIYNLTEKQFENSFKNDKNTRLIILKNNKATVIKEGN